MARFRTVLPAAALAVSTLAGAALAQTPQPFPRPGSAPPPAEPRVPPPPPAQGAPTPATPPAAAAPVQAPPAAAAPAAPRADGVPTAATLGVPIYPGAEFITSYDAGRGQRYYIFGTTGSYADAVTFYRTQLRDKGDQVFEQPATHMFSIARFREETMAFTPGVTVKDFTWGGSQGYPNPAPGAATARFPTVIMIVPLPAPAAPAAAPAR